MAKKLLGERQIGDAVYTAGQILSDEEFAKSGLTESDVATVAAPTTAAAAPVETAAAPADKDAELDTSSKQTEQESTQAGGSNDAASGAGGAASAETQEGGEELTIEKVLTEQDLTDNPELTARGLAVGATVRVAAEYKVLTQADLDADASYTQEGKTVGDKVLVAKA